MTGEWQAWRTFSIFPEYFFIIRIVALSCCFQCAFYFLIFPDLKTFKKLFHFLNALLVENGV